ncbi:SpoIID/LytB domain protein [Bacillus mesophilus]|uniref:SpoIID/LytB domain-containing protein n=1 Tax=Bacillus mesophilus TaxID=1808955 RepID=A0A6M0QCW8_9BACI|nr:SpoIID/LytB domain-containing protein [Bacillus mesophilus]MBM7663455.1 SpoIID/LytB domain protein [Bacillus mesophilus]NEY74194.1 SpoIID/LytB domain-containing protein [Bacillus mesophilus]
MRYLFGFLICLFLLVPFPVKAEEMVKVKLQNYIGETPKVTLELKGDYVTLDPTLTLIEGTEYGLVVKKGRLYLIGGGEEQLVNGTLALVPRSYDENHVISINERPYLGAFEFQVENGIYIRPVNQLPLEDYLKGVVPFEVFPSWGIETLKAQALAARTYAVSHLKADMNDTIQYQVYAGYDWKSSTTKAVEETKGEVITFGNSLIDAFYSASNGGMTENNVNVWGGKSISYYPIKADPYDPVNPWEFKLKRSQIELNEVEWDMANSWEDLVEQDTEITDKMKKWLARNGYSGDIKIVSIPSFQLSESRLKSERSLRGSISIQFLQRIIDGTVLYNELKLEDVNLNKIRPMIGGTLFKSYLIDSLDFNGEYYSMKGRGYGHGVGMSQWGAHFMGEEGKNYKEILQFYFPGTEITNLSDKS